MESFENVSELFYKPFQDIKQNIHKYPTSKLSEKINDLYNQIALYVIQLDYDTDKLRREKLLEFFDPQESTLILKSIKKEYQVSLSEEDVSSYRNALSKLVTKLDETIGEDPKELKNRIDRLDKMTSLFNKEILPQKQKLHKEAVLLQEKLLTLAKTLHPEEKPKPLVRPYKTTKEGLDYLKLQTDNNIAQNAIKDELSKINQEIQKIPNSSLRKSLKTDNLAEMEKTLLRAIEERKGKNSKSLPHLLQIQKNLSYIKEYQAQIEKNSESLQFFQ